VAAEVAGRVEAYGTRTAEARTAAGALPAGSTIAEGQPVTAGDPLVILNRDLLQARHDQAAAQFEHDEQDYQRIAGLFERGTAPPTEMRKARTSRDVSKAILDEATRSLARATIVAPMSGILNEWRMELGEYALPGSAVAEIVDIDQVKVRVDVPERDVGYLRVGQTAEIISLGSETDTVTGKITYINALADQATRTTSIEVTVNNRVTATNPAKVPLTAGPVRDTGRQAARGTSANPDKEYHLRSGQIVKVRLTRRVLENVTMVPLASVIPLEHGKEVYVVRNGKAERRPVELGFIRGRSVQAVSGLERGELLIVAGHRLVSPGQPVKVIDSRPAATLAEHAEDTGGQAASGTMGAKGTTSSGTTDRGGAPR
jgi:membrane fusion protein (multidrug efflux system)